MLILRQGGDQVSSKYPGMSGSVPVVLNRAKLGDSPSMLSRFWGEPFERETSSLSWRDGGWRRVDLDKTETIVEGITFFDHPVEAKSNIPVRKTIQEYVALGYVYHASAIDRVTLRHQSYIFDGGLKIVTDLEGSILWWSVHYSYWEDWQSHKCFPHFGIENISNRGWITGRTDKNSSVTGSTRTIVKNNRNEEAFITVVATWNDEKGIVIKASSVEKKVMPGEEETFLTTSEAFIEGEGVTFNTLVMPRSKPKK
jgi:hypothetical protein